MATAQPRVQDNCSRPTSCRSKYQGYLEHPGSVGGAAVKNVPGGGGRMRLTGAKKSGNSFFDN